MHFLSLQNFQNYLIQSKLVEPAQLQECMVRLQSRGQSIDGLIRELEVRHLLTPYQAAKLRKRDLEGLLLGRFKLLYRNASGSFARVFRGCSIDDGRMIGIKVLRSRWAEDPRKVTLFKREGELGKRLKHKNIVPIYEVGSEGNQHFLTMEFVEGGNFRELLRGRGKFSPEEATRYAIDIAEGLEYALSLGVTHRDMKLTNVLLSAKGLPSSSISDWRGRMLYCVQLTKKSTEQWSMRLSNETPVRQIMIRGAIYTSLVPSTMNF